MLEHRVSAQALAGGMVGQVGEHVGRPISVRCAPWRIRSLAPAERGSSGEPGTPKSSRPASLAMRAVSSEPERCAASITTSPSASPAMIRLRLGKCRALRCRAERRLGHDGALLGDPRLQPGVLRRVGHVQPAGDHRDGLARPQRARYGRRHRCRAPGPRPRPAAAASSAAMFSAKRMPLAEALRAPTTPTEGAARSATSPSTASAGGASGNCARKGG